MVVGTCQESERKINLYESEKKLYCLRKNLNINENIVFISLEVEIMEKKSFFKKILIEKKS